MQDAQDHPLRIARQKRNLSMQDVADATTLGWKTIWRAEQGHELRPESKRLLCEFFGMSAEELGLLPSNKLESESPNVEAALKALDNLENEGVDMNRSRRTFLQLIGAVGLGTAGTSYLSTKVPLSASLQSPVKVTNTTIDSIATIIQTFRNLQRAGLTTESGLRDQITFIQSTLENTTHEGNRRELWHLLAKSQLLARHSITNKAELGRARTWNEAAIASAQYSGDTLLFGAALGHLGHLYLIYMDDTEGAYQLIEQARSYVKEHPVGGWLAMVAASIAAKEGKQHECEVAIDQALETAHSLPQTPESTDLYYTDFNIVGTNAFSGNCLLKVGAPTQALERLLAVDLEALSKNRHASAFHDIACAYAAMGELEATQSYAFRSIDTALATNRLYIVPRFINLAQKIQQQDPHETHSASILEYAHNALPKGGTVA